MKYLKAPLTPEQQEEAVSALVFFCQIETCYFAMSRRWKHERCKDDTGKGFDCCACRAEYFLESIGIKVDRR